METSKKLKIACVIGTRPEVIKMAPIIFKLQASDWAEVFLINTAQHRNLLDDLLILFDLKPDIDLNSMTQDQSLGMLTSTLCSKMDELMRSHHFDAMLAVGDTTTVFVSALIAFYHHIPFGHIEAGLRTYSPHAREPFPEEINRILTAPLATWHFVPTDLERTHLLAEHIAAKDIVVTGNPVIDTLYWVLEHKRPMTQYNWPNTVIVTAHRRENFGRPIHQICEAVMALAKEYLHLNFVFPVHPNPRVQEDIFRLLANQENIHLLKPLRYDEFAHLMNQAIFMMTDSGGIQEEAPALGKPVLVLRNTTERTALIEEGLGLLIGTEKEEIIAAVRALLRDKGMYKRMSRGFSPYGDGQAADRIIECLRRNQNKIDCIR